MYLRVFPDVKKYRCEGKYDDVIGGENGQYRSKQVDDHHEAASVARQRQYQMIGDEIEQAGNIGAGARIGNAEEK